MATVIVGIYKITSPSGKVYIGQSWHLFRRIKGYKSIHCSKQKLLYKSLKKYGSENHIFKIIHELPNDVTQNVLDSYEIFYIQQYKDCGFEMMNLTHGGSKGKPVEEVRLKMSLRQLGNSKRLGKKKPLSEETKINMSIAHSGKKFSNEHKQNLKNNHGKKKTIYQYDLDKNLLNTWSSVKQANSDSKMSANNISRWAAGTRTNYTNYIWSYNILIK